MCKKLLNLFFILLFVTGIPCIPAFAANDTASDDAITFTTSRAVGENIKLNIKASDNIEISGIAETTNLTGFEHIHAYISDRGDKGQSPHLNVRTTT